MQQLTINLIPLEINNATLQCSFYTEKFEGSYPLHRSELPCEIWDNHQEEIKDKFYYTSFEIWNVLNLIAIGYLIYRIIKRIRKRPTTNILPSGRQSASV